MVFAAVDVGSNTLRLLIAEVINGNLLPLRYERVITRLASGLKDTGVIREGAARMSVGVLREFAEIIRGSGASKTRCVGTSALREAQNTAIFKEMSQTATGLEIELITGDEEASLTARGVLSAMTTPGSYVIVDIGGGSTEVIYSSGQNDADTITEPVGVVKMAETYMSSDPPSEKDIGAMWAEADVLSKDVSGKVLTHVGGKRKFIGTGGTASTIAAIDLELESFDPGKVHNHRISIEKLNGMLTMLKSLAHAERAGVKGLEPQRADLIIPGIILTISLMKELGFTSMIICNAGLLEGIVLDLAGGG